MSKQKAIDASVQCLLTEYVHGRFGQRSRNRTAYHTLYFSHLSISSRFGHFIILIVILIIQSVCYEPD